MMAASGVSDVVEMQTIEHALVLRQLERILAHTSFRNSQRYRTFLRYVVEERLQGNTLNLKERMIGVSVFHQPLDYDTNANAVVRVTAGEIRRRLSRYYGEASAEDDVLIELPIGGYVPEFRLREIAVLPAEPAHAVDQDAIPFDTGLSKQKLPLAVEQPRSQRSVWRRYLLVVALTAGIAILGMAIWRIAKGGPPRDSETDRFWNAAFGKREVLLCAGPQGWNVTQQPATALDRPNNGVSFTSARTAALIGSAIGHAGGSASLLGMQDARLEDLQKSPVVLIGAFNNEWTLRLQSPLRYQFARTDTSLAIVDTRNPKVEPIVEDVPAMRGYGIIAHFHSPATGQSTMIVGGLGMHGTAAARIFLSSPELLREFSKTAPRGWEEKNYEMVLSSDLVNNLADSPKVIHAEFW